MLKERGFQTCGECREMDACELVGGVHKAVPEAITNLPVTFTIRDDNDIDNVLKMISIKNKVK